MFPKSASFPFKYSWTTFPSLPMVGCGYMTVFWPMAYTWKECGHCQVWPIKSLCHRLNVYSLSKFIWWNLILNVMILGGRVFGIWLSHESGTLMCGIGALLWETPESSLVPTMWGHREKTAVYEPGSRPHQRWNLLVPWSSFTKGPSKSIKGHFPPLFLWTCTWFAIRPHVSDCNSLFFPNKSIFLEKYLAVCLRSTAYLAHQNSVFVN